jgi:hypothetical protein
MRLLVIGFLIAIATPIHAADKDEDKAKEVVAAFLKGLKDKDLEAMMKTADVPFIFDMGVQSPKTIEKRDELKDVMAKLIEIAQPEKVKALEVGKVYDMSGLAKQAKDSGAPEEEIKKFIEQAEKLVGKDGRMVMLMKGGEEGKGAAGLLVRFKDGKALIASVPK